MGFVVLQRLEFETDGFEVGCERLLEQVWLPGVQLLAAAGELPAIEDRPVDAIGYAAEVES